MSYILKISSGIVAVAAVNAPPETREAFFLGWLMEPDHAMAIAIGILISIVMQVGIMVKQEKPRAQIQRNLLVNILAAAGNFFLCGWIVGAGDFSPISGLVLAVVIGIAGVDIYIELGKRAVTAVPEFFRTLLIGKKSDD